MTMDRTSWKKAAAIKVFLLFLTSGVFKGWVVGELADVCASCHANATCENKTDGSGGKVCICMYGFLGNGRTQCLDKDECEIGAEKICGNHTMCHNTYGSFYCTCLNGYSPSNNLAIFIPNDGTQCNDIDECRIQGICGEGGRCRNMQGDFNCLCQVGYRVENGFEPFHPHQDKAFCRAIDCGRPPSVPHTIQLSSKGTRYGSVVKFGCLEGFFQKSGQGSAVCGLKGVWEGPSLVCEEIDCGEPPALPHSNMEWNKRTTMSSEVYYKCNDGFHNVGHGNVAVCTASGQWDSASVVCEEIKCGDPPVLPHSGQAWNGSTSLGSSVVYYCNEGFYHAEGENVSFCAGNGYWTKSTLLCKEIECGRPPVPQSVAVQWNGGTRVGSVAYYTCLEGFHEAGGGKMSVCTVSGLWQSATLSCKEIDCSEPPALPYSVMLWNKTTTVGSVVYYKCNDGFYNAGNKSFSVCTAEGYWDSPNTLCQEIDCGEPPALPYSVMVWNKSTTVGAVVYYKCNDGFHNVGLGNVSVCTANGSWDRASLLCEEIDCGEPPALPNTDIVWNKSTKMGAVVYHECADGFHSVGGRNVSVCTAHGYWDNATLLCEEINCGEPISVPHSTMLWDKTTKMGSVVHYHCDEGYYSTSERDYSVCRRNGLWEDIALHCEEIDCGPPAIFPNTDMHWANTSGLGSVVHYTCKSGFYQVGASSHSTCTSAREWEHITVTCKANCGPAPVPAHTEVVWQNGTLAGSAVLYRCLSGYRSRRGTSMSVCTDAGKWRAATLVCRDIKSAIRKLVVFNEKCLQWKADVYDGEEEDYMVQFVGFREYQRTFQDSGKRVFSSAANRPELCLNLLPGTNYTINITALSASFSSIVSANTSIQVPRMPEVAFRDIEAPLPSLWLRRSASTLDPISVYQVFVVPLEGPVEFDCRSPRAPHFHGRGKSSGLYVAAQMRVEEMGGELSFTVGDQHNYGGYYNAPLEDGRDYYIILRAVNQWGKVRKQSCVIWAKVRGVSYTVQSVTLMAGGSVGLVAFVTFLGHSCVWYCKKK